MPSRAASLLASGVLMLAAIVGGRAGAEPLDRKQLPADARWFVHVDLDAAPRSQVGKTIRSLWLSTGEPRQWLQEFRDATGADVFSDLHGVTVFNTSFDRNQAVALIRGDVDQARVLALAAGLPDHRTAAHGAYELHLWTDPKRGGTSAGAFYDKNTVVIGSDSDAVCTELDLLDGKGKSLVSNQSPLAQPAPGGAFVEIGARGLSTAHDLPFESPIVKQSEDLVISLGERDGRTFLHGRLIMSSADVAEQIRALLDGMRALVTLKAHENPTLLKLLSAARVTADDRSVRVDWDAANEDVTRGIRRQFEKPGGPPATEPDERQ